MANKTVSGTLFKRMITNGAVNLKNNHKEIDHLNVFPVPDGDTGTNMQMTMMAGVKEVKKTETESIIDISKILSRGLLMGARGNSGVILSQFFRGLYSEISKIDNGSATVDEFIQALVGGYQMAYRAVMDPVEGTILTVVRESAEKVLQERQNLNSVEDVLKVYLQQAKETLTKTPELLPVLKEAGVVDSGGAGFIKIIEGWVMALNGEELSEQFLNEAVKADLHDHDHVGAHALGEIDIKFGYCTEFIVKLFDYEKFDEKFMKEPLSQMGDSLVVVTDDDLLKVHVHTNQPGVALTLAQKYGDIQTIKVENMRLQHSTIMDDVEPHTHAPKVKKEKSKYAVIAVAAGEGIKNAFIELGVDKVIDGGQTMNPSAEDFVNAINDVNAENIILLPNNSNIILTAEQTIELCPEHNIRVVKSKNIAQGYGSLIAFDPTIDLDENHEVMTEAIKEMKSGEVTYSIRDTELKGVKISEGDFIGIAGGEIKVAEKTRLDATKKLVDLLVTTDSEIATIFFGEEVDEDELEDVVAHVKQVSPDIEVELVDGKQDIYSYILAIE
ncbi:DAK2 domain-containing protein [Haploplasma axanthum]|uniref:Dihydroxyacetone (Glycerone) kinase, DhaK2 subunit n=1 Tax=Haploplasma axanthum TaxID=29552 RepID=A0A449BFG9_HAPAX|nr:DAK2 domain-containing protein [Haploplasma axanthum]VEU81165.1 dihydroxyacetone (glycerone) kinase, DhaK2 subunit [Haploplasma axanthum]